MRRENYTQNTYILIEATTRRGREFVHVFVFVPKLYNLTFPKPLSLNSNVDSSSGGCPKSRAPRRGRAAGPCPKIIQLSRPLKKYLFHFSSIPWIACCYLTRPNQCPSSLSHKREENTHATCPNKPSPNDGAI